MSFYHAIKKSRTDSQSKSQPFNILSSVNSECLNSESIHKWFNHNKEDLPFDRIKLTEEPTTQSDEIISKIDTENFHLERTNQIRFPSEKTSEQEPVPFPIIQISPEKNLKTAFASISDIFRRHLSNSSILDMETNTKGRCIIYWCITECYLENNIALYLAQELWYVDSTFYYESSHIYQLPLLIVFPIKKEDVNQGSISMNQLHLYSKLLQFRVQCYDSSIPLYCCYIDSIFQFFKAILDSYCPLYIISDYNLSLSFANEMDDLLYDNSYLMLSIYPQFYSFLTEIPSTFQGDVQFIYQNQERKKQLKQWIERDLNELKHYQPPPLDSQKQTLFWKKIESIHHYWTDSLLSQDSIDCLQLNEWISQCTIQIPPIKQFSNLNELDWKSILFYLTSKDKMIHPNDPLESGAGVYTTIYTLNQANHFDCVSNLSHLFAQFTVVDLALYLLKSNTLSLYTLLMNNHNILEDAMNDQLVNQLIQSCYHVHLGTYLLNHYSFQTAYQSISPSLLSLLKEITDSSLNAHEWPVDILEGHVSNNELYNAIIMLFKHFSYIPTPCLLYIYQYIILYMFHIPPYLFMNPLYSIFTSYSNQARTVDLVAVIVSSIHQLLIHYQQHHTLYDSKELTSVFHSLDFFLTYMKRYR